MTTCHVQTMTWRRTGIKALTVLMMSYCTGVYMRHSILISQTGVVFILLVEL